MPEDNPNLPSTDLRQETPEFNLVNYARLVTESQQAQAYLRELNDIRAKYYSVILERDKMQSELIQLQERIRTARDVLLLV